MPKVAFFPWLRLAEGLRLNGFELVPWRREREPSGPRAKTPDPRLQASLDAIFDHYFADGDHSRPVNVGTVVRVGDHELTAELDDSDHQELFLLSEIVAFGGLAGREFFEPFGGITYCNADLFQFFIQSYTTEPAGAAIAVRGRDGPTLNYVSGSAYRVHAPVHVQPSDPTFYRLSQDLVAALLEARSRPEWLDFEESIFWFNRANTDDPLASEHNEAVMLISALERLFDLKRGQAGDLARAIVQALVPASERRVGDTPRVLSQRFPNRKMSVREAWTRDFYDVRNEHAHGRREGRQSVWPLNEHLLLGALAFPLLVKSRLKDVGLYELTEKDRDNVDLFERFASEDAFAHLRAPMESRPQPAWQRIRGERFEERMEEAIQREIEQWRAHEGPGPPEPPVKGKEDR